MIPNALDALGRPAQVSNSAIQSAPLVRRAYTPDGLTASLTIARDNTTFNVTNFTYDGLDRLATTTYPDTSTESLSYDADGNVLTRQTRAGQTITFTYDTLNRLATKAAPSEPTVTVGTTTTIYVTDPVNRAVVDYDGTTGAVQNWYAFGSGPNGALNQMNVGASTRATFIPDTQGSVIASLDSGSGTITKAGYQLYGESGSTAGTFRYTGARIDAETNGLYDFRARMYSPALGRFLQPDPTGIRGGMNLYAYAGNDPINRVDPFGLDPKDPSTGNYQFYVAIHPAFVSWDPAYHSAIIIVDLNTYSGGLYSLGAQPQGAVIQGASQAVLASAPNYPGDLAAVSDPSKVFPMQTPPNQTPTEYYENLIGAAASYPNNQPYSALATGNTYNSNSFPPGVIQAAGGSPPDISGYWLPGSNKPLPIDYTPVQGSPSDQTVQPDQTIQLPLAGDTLVGGATAPVVIGK